MTRLFYTLAFYLLLPVLVLRLVWRSRLNPAYRQRLGERFGFVPHSPSNKPLIWLHSVSVGETIAASPLVEELLKSYPTHGLWITTTTSTGSATVKRLYGERVLHSYFPYDIPQVVQRFLRCVKPQIVLVVETEIWPNLYTACQQQGIPLLLLNARLSARTFQRYQYVHTLTRQTLQAITRIAARSQQDANYFQQLGANAAQLNVCGNLKFALQIPASVREQAQTLKQQWGKRPIVVAASTHAGEDETVLQTFSRLRQQFPQLLLILVPRHPERFETVYALCTNIASTLRRSSQQTLTHDTAILLGDTLGELLLWYALADMAFIGGSLIERGGHNPLEAAAFGVPILSGKYTHNFADIFPPLYAAGGAVEVADANALYEYCLQWLNEPALRQHIGRQAAIFFNQQHRVLDCLLAQIAPYVRNFA